MTRATALKIAKIRFEAYQKADIEHMFRGAPAPDADEYGYRHGWMKVAHHSFGPGELYEDANACPVQAAFAYL